MKIKDRWKYTKLRYYWRWLKLAFWARMVFGPVAPNKRGWVGWECKGRIWYGSLITFPVDMTEEERKHWTN